MIETLIPPGLLLAGVLVGYFLKRVTSAPVSMKLELADLNLYCSSTILDSEATELDDLDVCSEKATVVRNGNSLCKDHEEEYLAGFLSANAPDDLKDLDD